MVVVCAAEAADELDDSVLLADGDLTVAAGAAVELAGDAADQVDLVALFVDAGEAPANARLSLELAHRRLAIQAKPAAMARLAAPASCSPSVAPGRLTAGGAGPGGAGGASCSPSFAPGRLTAGEADQRASVAISVPRSQASACQSAALPRRAATRWAAAKVSQTGPLRRKRCFASGVGSSWPSTFRVAAGAAMAALRSTRSKAIMLRLVRRRASSRVIARQIQPEAGRERVRFGEMDRRDQDRDEVPTAQKPFRLHPGAFRRILTLPERRRPLHRRPPRRGGLPHRRGAGPESEHLVLDGGALLPGPRLRGLPRAAAGGDRGVPDDDRQQQRQRRGPLFLRPLRAPGSAPPRLLEPRGKGAQGDHRPSECPKRGVGRRAADRHRRARPTRLP